jgi:ketosteroid isomerase-like protein
MPHDVDRGTARASEDHLALVRRYLDGWETGDAATFEEVLSADFFDDTSGRRRDRAALIAEAANTDFVDRSVTIEEAIVSGDTVVLRTTGRHTHAASGRRVTVSGMIWVRIADGRIVTGWGEHDRLGQLQQLDVIPSGAAALAWMRERLPVAATEDGSPDGAT